MANTAKDYAREPLPQRRQTTREAVSHETEVLWPGNRAIAVRLVDLSPKGFHARSTERPFERGESVAVRLPLIGQVQARVMWGLRGCFGCQFLVPIDARTCLDVLAMIHKDETSD